VLTKLKLANQNEPFGQGGHKKLKMILGKEKGFQNECKNTNWRKKLGSGTVIKQKNLGKIRI
jgi:hypothetical protein